MNVLNTSISSLFLIGSCAVLSAQELVPTRGFVVDRESRESVLEFWEEVYAASEGFAENFLGEVDVEDGVLGEGGEVFEGDVLRRVNYYRAMAGLSASVKMKNDAPVYLRKDDEHFAGVLTTKGEAARGAALMFTANNFLSHRPGSHWDIFYSARVERCVLQQHCSGVLGRGCG